MITVLAEKKRFNESVFMGILTLICLGLSIMRLVYTDTKVFIFLNWNLFLAFIPWALTSLAINRPTIQKSGIAIVLLLGIWLLFFPNSPYILTDLYHLKERTTMPIWFDLVLILAFAWTGLLFGFLSLWDIEKILSKSIKPVYIGIISSSLLFLGSFGIYLGRYLRWNSWDIISEPYKLIYDIGETIVNPFSHPKAWGMTFFMGLFLNMIYWSLRLIKKRNYEVA